MEITFHIISSYTRKDFPQCSHDFLILAEARYVTGDLVLLPVTWKVINHFGGFRFLRQLGRSCAPSCRSRWISTRSAAEIHHAPKWQPLASATTTQHRQHIQRGNSQQLTANINVNVRRRSRTRMCSRMGARMCARMWARTRRRQRRLTGGRKESPIKWAWQKGRGGVEQSLNESALWLGVKAYAF